MAPYARRPVWRIALTLALVFALTSIPLASAGAGGGQPAVAEHVPDRVLVGFKPGTPGKAVAAAHAAAGAKVEGRIPQIGVDIMKVPKGRTVHGLIKMYEKNPNVVFAEPDYIATVEMTPDDPKYPEQWAHPYVNTPAAWGTNSGSASVTIAVLDTGLDITHPEISDRVVSGYDFVNGDADPSDDHGHGTRVTGLAAATGNNARGVAGMDWNARIMPVKVMNSSGTGSWSTVARGLTYATDNGANVINMSIGGPASSTLQSAVQYAYGKGVTLCAAAGNGGTEYVEYPAAYPEVIAVGSVWKDRLSSFSSYGSQLSVVAPGEGVWTIERGGGYRASAGTSAATPFVAGLAALLHAAKPGISPVEVEAAITRTARDLGDPGWDKYFGWGHIDAAAALAAIGTPTPSDPEPATPPAEDSAPEPVPAPDPEPEPVADPTPSPATPVDTIAPVVSISSPTSGSTVSGVVTIRAEAGDDVGVVRVEFYVNGSLLGTSTSPGYSINWNTKKLSGEYTLTAVAYDAAGNAGTSSPVKVMVGTAQKTPPAKKK